MRHRLCALSDVEDDNALRVEGVPGFDVPLAVVRTGGGVFCVDDTCSHQAASLSDGWVEDGCIECPLHESRFDLHTGHPDVPPARQPIRTHPVEVEGGVVYIVAPS